MNFLYQMVLGEDNRPDEAKFTYLVTQVVIIAAFAFNGYKAGHFELMDLCIAETALIALYNASVGIRGAIGKGS